MSLKFIRICSFYFILIVTCGVVCGNVARNSAAAESGQSKKAIPTSVLSVPSTESSSSKLSFCGNTQKLFDECFKDLPPHLIEFLLTTKTAINEEEVIFKCNVFKRGMQCFDNYTKRCLTNETINIYNNNVEGARRFFKKFCDDSDFRKEYLQHKDCFATIQEDWVRCTNLFETILTEELHNEEKNITNIFFEFCCARHAYENCIYKSARYKCYKESAKFAQEAAKTLSDEKHFTNCRLYEKVLCKSAATHLAKSQLYWYQLLIGSLLFDYYIFMGMKNN